MNSRETVLLRLNDVHPTRQSVHVHLHLAGLDELFHDRLTTKCHHT